MRERLDLATATLLLRQYGTWFGPPAIWYQGKCIDGRIRAQGITEIFSRYDRENGYLIIPLTSTTARTCGDAVRLLCLAGEYERVRELELIPIVLTDTSEIAAYCHCPEEIVAPLAIRKHFRGPRMQAHSTPARRRAIEKIAQLLRRAEQSTGTVTTTELRKALEQWL